MISSGIFYAVMKVIDVNKEKKKTNKWALKTPVKIVWIVELWILINTNCFLPFIKICKMQPLDLLFFVALC